MMSSVLTSTGRLTHSLSKLSADDDARKVRLNAGMRMQHVHEKKGEESEDCGGDPEPGVGVGDVDVDMSELECSDARPQDCERATQGNHYRTCNSAQ